MHDFFLKETAANNEYFISDKAEHTTDESNRTRADDPNHVAWQLLAPHAFQFLWFFQRALPPADRPRRVGAADHSRIHLQPANAPWRARPGPRRKSIWHRRGNRTR